MQAFIFGSGFGTYEMMIFGVIALLLFGKRLPEVARSAGQSLSEFKKGMSGLQDEVRNAGNSYEPSTSDSSSSRPKISNDTEETTSAPRFELEPPAGPPT